MAGRRTIDKALAAAAAKADLKLMSFNIRYYKPGADGDNGWVARRAACLEMIRAESPDVIGFQEPHRPQIDYLKVNLPEYALSLIHISEPTRP